MSEMILDNATVFSRLEELVLAPANHPEILPAVLPLILGWFIIELYFGKHKDERLGWNTSVGNAVLWVATGISLFLTGDVQTVLERNASLLLVGAGVFVGYMNFYHKWSTGIAYRIASADIIYPLAYATVIVVKTDMPVDETVLKASAAFMAGTILLFRVVRLFETPARDSFPVPR